MYKALPTVLAAPITAFLLLLAPVTHVYAEDTNATNAILQTESVSAAANASAAEEPADSEPPSDVFGAWLFTGEFADDSFAGFNPDYQIGVGDRITLKLWGGYEYEAVLEVDAQGNVFIPRVGPVNVLNVRNELLNMVVQENVKRIYKKNVGVYASLEAAQPVQVFVTGFVEQPGLYDGFASDSVLHYLDDAGGIDPERGSFLDVRILRDGQVRQKLNLYSFLLSGELVQTQFLDGDVIVVGARRHTVRVTGLAQNPFRFEFSQEQAPVGEILSIARPNPEATNIRVVRNQGKVRDTEYYALDALEDIALRDGDEIILTADKKPGTIAVRVEGEHDSKQEYVLAYGSRLDELLPRIDFNTRSDTSSLQLFRLSVRDRQRELLAASLASLESSVLTARSATNEEAQLRTQEANLVLQWIDRAKDIEPRGQVVLANSSEAMYGSMDVLLENGDVIRVPAKDDLVVVSGEVMRPNAMIYSPSANVLDYIDQAGGYTQDPDTSQVLIMHRDGSFIRAEELDAPVRAGDEILVLPKVDLKSLQITKDITQILYQIAIAAGVALAI
jgi:protein involved in polysaccharide export with SLBB domain